MRPTRWQIPSLVLLLCFAAFQPATASAAVDSSWAVRTWQVADGSNNLITGVAQSPDGFLWVSTAHGLNQFDGVHFQNYSFGEHLGLPNSSIRMLCAGRNGELWAAMDNAVVLFRRNNAPILIRDNIPALRPNNMVVDNQGSLWIGYLASIGDSAGLVCRITEDGKAAILNADAGIPDRSKPAVAVDNSGHVWVGNSTYLGLIQDGRYVEVADLSGRVSMAPAHGGGLWACTRSKLYKYDAKGNGAELATLPPSLDTEGQLKLLEDHRGLLWIASTTAGLFRYDGADVRSVTTPQARITSLEEDSEGNLWLGTDAGLDRVSPRAIEVEAAEAGVPAAFVNSVCQSPDGVMWAVMTDGSLKVRSQGHWNNPPFSTSNASCVACAPDGSIWIGTKKQRVDRWQSGRLGSWDARKGLISHTTTALLAARNNDLWIGGIAPHSIQCLRSGRLIEFKSPSPINHVNAIAEDQKGNIWLGASGPAGLLMISGDQVFDRTSLIDNDPVQALCVTPDDTLWIGFRFNGIGRFKNGLFTMIRSAQGLNEDNISQIVSDGRGSLWFGSGHGIFKIQQVNLDDVADGKPGHINAIHFGGDESLPPLQARTGVSPSALRTKDGSIWMAMATALAIVHPERMRQQLVPPAIYIQRVAVDDNTLAAAGNYLNESSQSIDEPQKSPLKLQPGYRKLEFDFTALTFSAPDSTRFRYRLEGFDVNWSEPTELRNAGYPRLPAGNYRFRVIACNADGIWNEQGAEMAIAVAPFLWQTWWFQLTALIAFTTVLILLARYWSFRHLRARLLLAEQRGALERERARIARDIHDDLGCGLTKIALLSELMAQSSPDETNGHLRQIALTAKQQIKSLDETVWAINPRNDTVVGLIDYIGHFAVESLRAANIRCQIDLPEDLPDRVVPAEVRHSLFLIVKEAINNVMRHAQATQVHICITISSDAMTLEIVDNGRGFSFLPGYPGQDGLKNMEQRMRDIGGRFALNSSTTEGTRIRLNYPWSSRAEKLTTISR